MARISKRRRKGIVVLGASAAEWVAVATRLLQSRQAHHRRHRRPGRRPHGQGSWLVDQRGCLPLCENGNRPAPHT